MTRFRVYRKLIVMEVVTVNAETTEDAIEAANAITIWNRIEAAKPTEVHVIPEECFEDDDLEVL